jgi:hypothetical protein
MVERAEVVVAERTADNSVTRRNFVPRLNIVSTADAQLFDL